MGNENHIDIVVIVNYFGKPLPYLQLWLDSCGFNKEIAWLFVTDAEMRDYDVPDNVRIIKSSFEKVRARFERVFPFRVRYERPWDFCAFRPAFGTIFAEEIGCADHWGWADCDVIFGNLTPVVKSCMDAAIKVMPKGHFSLVKNDDRLNQFILQHHLTHKALAIGQSGLPCFDEVGFPLSILSEFGGFQNNDIPFVNMACRYGNFVLDDTASLFNRLRIVPEHSRDFPFVMTWNHGHLFAHFVMEDGCVEKVEIAYSHFFRRDMEPRVSRLSLGNNYLIAPNFIERYDGHELKPQEIRHLDRFRIHWAYCMKRLSLKFLAKKTIAILANKN